MASSSESNSRTAPMPMSRIPGEMRVMTANPATVAHGRVSPQLCERVFLRAIDGWGIGGTDAGSRAELIVGIAQALAYGTSAEIVWDTVYFEHEGSPRNMAVLFDAAAQMINYQNPVRVWARHFRNGEIPVTIYALLKNAENVALRQTAAQNYGMPVAQVQFCFDLADALLSSGMVLSTADLQTIRAVKSAVLTRSNVESQSRGFTQAVSNKSDLGPSVEAVTGAGGIQPPAARAKFQNFMG